MTGTEETLRHIRRVAELLGDVARRLLVRGERHDASKLESPEREAFDRIPGQLASITYGSPEYAACLAELKPALDHHYRKNSHHPEHYADGVHGMSLLDLVEMLADWKAASERHVDGDVVRSIEHNQARFGYSDALRRILLNTVAELGYASHPEGAT